MIEFISFIIFIIALVGLTFDNVRLKIKNTNLLYSLLQERIDKNIIIDKINSDQKMQESEGFLKFVSQSREHAFKYIEDVQKSLYAFKKAVKSDLDYFDNFSLLSEGHPLHDSMNTISKAYKELEKMLPDDYGKIEE